MVNKNVLGIIFSHYHGESMKELVEQRTVASIPFGCRYRLIDFTLSNMVNAGIDEVGIVTDRNYSSLMNHLGSGREWDLARKKGGLYMLPPLSEGGARFNASRVLELRGVTGMLNNSKAEYVIVADSNLVYNMDYNQMLLYHKENEADITMLYCKMPIHSSGSVTPHLQLDLGGERVEKITVAAEDPTKPVNKYLNVFVIKKELLMRIINRAVSETVFDFERGVLMNLPSEYRVLAYEYTNYLAEIDSLQEYFRANMELLDRQKREELFRPQSPIYTKVHDEVPVTYGLNSKANNSLIADGAIIEGEVENSIIFRNVKIGKGAKVKNCILMQGSIVGADAQLNYVITDKAVAINDGRMIMGYDSYPVFIKKNSIV